MAVFSWLTSQLVLIGWNVLGITSLAGATIFANVVLGAALLGLAAVAGGVTSQQPTARNVQAQAVINQSTGVRYRGYGRALLGGTRAFWDSKSGDLYQVIMMHSGEIDAIEHVCVGDIVATLDGNGDATNSALSWTPPGGSAQRAVRVRQYLGTASQTADSMMTGAWPGVWTSDHRLRGIAYLAVRFRSPPNDQLPRIFPESYNTPVRGLCRLSKVWDPRSDVTAWNDNAALCILDYLVHPDGYRLTIDDIDVPSFVEMANLCDENVPLAAGGTEKRYRLWGVYSLNDEPHAVLRKMLNTCDGEIYETPEGKIAIRGGKWTAPTVTINAISDLGHTLEEGSNKFAAFNQLKIIYTSPMHDYQPMEAVAWKNLADQADRGPIVSDFDLDFVPSPSQARRLAKIYIAKANPRWKGTVRTNALGMNALGERTIRLIEPELQIDEAFFVAGLTPSPDLASVELEVIAISEAAYSWNPATEGGQSPPPAQDTTPDPTLPVPQNLTLSEPEEGHILAEVDDPERDGLTLQVQIRAGAGGNWIEMNIQDGGLSALITGMPPDEYQARARRLGAFGSASEWSFPLAEITTS